ncbi:MAG: type VI secretion system tube protein Hcp [Hamadaea sp.]|nr:type VI secretion system tube protein Hcp [Hamadaea sp.]NUT02220.1 type VI secretion system tube protein Hcp [Hamadaea sp.]
MRSLQRVLAAVAVTVAAVVATAHPAAAAPAKTTIFLKIAGIPGDSTDPKHSGEIELESFSFGVTNNGSGGGGAGGGSGKAVFGDLMVTKRADSASPKLFLAAANGTHLATAVLTVEKSRRAPMPYLTITLEEVLVSSFQTGDDNGGDTPYESIAFNYGKLTYVKN